MGKGNVARISVLKLKTKNDRSSHIHRQALPRCEFIALLFSVLCIGISRCAAQDASSRSTGSSYKSKVVEEALREFREEVKKIRNNDANRESAPDQENKYAYEEQEYTDEKYDSMAREILELKKHMKDMAQQKNKRDDFSDKREHADEKYDSMTREMLELKRHMNDMAQQKNKKDDNLEANDGMVKEKKRKIQKGSVITLVGLQFTPLQIIVTALVISVFGYLIWSSIESKNSQGRVDEKLHLMDLQRRWDNANTEKQMQLQQQMMQESTEYLRLQVMQHNARLEKEIRRLAQRQLIDKMYLEKQQMQNMCAISWALQKERQQHQLTWRAIHRNRRADEDDSPMNLLPGIATGAGIGARFGPWGAIIGAASGLLPAFLRRNRN